MALYSYIKVRKTKKKRITIFISLFFIFCGLLIFAWTLLPIVIFELYYAPKFESLLKPIPANKKNSVKNNLTHVLGVTTTDYTKASVWFPTASHIKVSTTNTKVYQLSIPKLKIDNAITTIGGDDLSKSLIHFTGPVPGNNGNAVILGHSTLLFLYNPKNYKAIFSKLPDLEINDDIIVSIDQVQYKYKVYDMYITQPDDLTPLSQTFDEPYITLITCVPQGTYLKRFIVKAKLSNFQ